MTMTTSASRPGRRPARRRRPAQRWAALLLASVAILCSGGCRAAGSAVIAPYRSPPLGQVTATALPGGAGVLALSPDGRLRAVLDPRRGVCFPAVGAAPERAACAALPPAGTAAISASFSPDGRWVAVGQDVTAQGRGRAFLVDPRTGAARAVPAADGRAPAASTGTAVGTAPASGASTPVPGVSAYTGMVWGAGGDLLLISSSVDADGARTRLVDVDPVSLVPRVVAEATGPYEFQSGYLATGGSTVLFTVYRGDQLLPNSVDVDLVSGVRREAGPIGPPGTRLVPLAVSPDGRVAMVGSQTLADPGPPRLLDVASGVLTEVPGLGGDFGAAAFSPDGARVAVASTEADGSVSLALVALGTAPIAPARTLGRFPGPLPRGGRMSWSQFDVLSLTGPAATGPGSIDGWALTG